jgi:hypothetical protein
MYHLEIPFLTNQTLHARHQWLMPVILSTQKAEIKRIVVRGQPMQTVHKTLSRKSPSQKGLVEGLKR